MYFVCKEIYKCKDMKLFSICRKKQLFLRKKVSVELILDSVREIK